MAMPENARKFSAVFFIIVSLKIPLYDCKYVTKFCPRNKTEWERKSNIFNCTSSKSYICLPNEQLTELVEFCYRGPQRPIQPGVCLFLEKRGFGLGSRSCSNFSNGCPDTSYSSDTIYTYPNCVSIGEGCFLADSSCKRNNSSPIYTSTMTTILTISTESNEDNDKQFYDRVLIFLSLICVCPIICMAVTIFLLFTKQSNLELIFCNRPKEESNENGDGIKCHDETVSLMQERDQENKPSNEIVSTEFGNKKEKIAQSDKLIDSQALSHPRGQDRNTIDSGLSNSSGFDPLHISCARGHEDTVTALIQNGACINACDQDGKTPLYISCENIP